MNAPAAPAASTAGVSTTLRPFWCRFYEADLEGFEYHGPWWVTAVDGQDRKAVCAAVMARDEDDAKRILRSAFDDGREPGEWCFVEAQEFRFSDRFRRADWMRWPWPLNPGDGARPPAAPEDSNTGRVRR